MELVLSFSVDTTTTPKRLDFWQTPAKVYAAIDELAGDQLRIAMTEGSPVTRPTTLATPEAIPPTTRPTRSQSVVIVLKKRM